MYEKDRLSNTEKAVQRKVQAGKHLTGDDKRVMQNRVRAMQRRGDLDGVAGAGMPGGATHVVPMPNMRPLVASMNAAFAALDGDKPNFGNINAQMAAPIFQMNSTVRSGSVNGLVVHTDSSSWSAMVNSPMMFTASVTYSLGIIHWNRDGGGAGAISGSSTAGGGDTTASGSAGGVSASGGATASGGSGGAAASGGASQSGSASNAGSGGQGGSASAQFDSYTAPILADWVVEYKHETTANPLSWLSSGGHGSLSGTAIEAGRYNFWMPA